MNCGTLKDYLAYVTKSHSESFYIKKALYFGNYRNMFPKIGKTSNTLGM